LISLHVVPRQWRPWFGTSIADEVAAQERGSNAIASYYYSRSRALHGANHRPNPTP
jgi:hypothetical protein